jgi:hypothetical protein
MSTSPQQPPLRPGDIVRHIYDRDHVETVKTCKLVAGPVPYWQTTTTWDGNHRIADAAEFVIEGGGVMMRRITRRLRAFWHRRELN